MYSNEKIPPNQPLSIVKTGTLKDVEETVSFVLTKFKYLLYSCIYLNYVLSKYSNLEILLFSPATLKNCHLYLSCFDMQCDMIVHVMLALDIPIQRH